MPRRSQLAVLTLLLLAPAPAQALRGFDLDVGFGTSVPALVGPSVVAELPLRILVKVEAVWLPAGYVNMINAIYTTYVKAPVFSVHAYWRF